MEAVIGIVASLEGHSVRTLECRRRDGTTFTSSLRSLHLQDECSIVKLSLWGQRLADEAGGRLCKGDLLLVTHVGIDRFMGEKGFKASGRRPQLTVIPSRAEAPRLLQRAVCQGREAEGDGEERLELYHSLLARAEALWQWKEVEDMRQADRERHAATRRSAAILGGGGGRGGRGGYGGKLRGEADVESSGGGHEGLMVGREDGEVRGVVREWQWRTVGVEEGGGGKGGGGRVIVFKLVDARGVGHVLEFPEDMGGVEQLECALRRKDALRRVATAEEDEQEEEEGEEEDEEDEEDKEEEEVQVVVSNVGCMVLAGGMMAPVQTARTCLCVVGSVEQDQEGRDKEGEGGRKKRNRKAGSMLVRVQTVREAWASLHPSPLPPFPPAPPASPSSLPPALTAQPQKQEQQEQQEPPPQQQHLLQEDHEDQEREEEPSSPMAPGTSLVLVGTVKGVFLPADEGGREGGREGEAECLPEVEKLAAVLVRRKSRVGALAEREERENVRIEEGGNGWVYRDLILLVADPPSSAPSSLPSSSSSMSSPSLSPRRELRVRVTDACLQTLVGHIPATRLVEEAKVDADGEGGKGGGKRRRKTLHTTAPPFFYTKWVRRALVALASPSNPPWKLTTRVLAVGEGKEERTREEEGGGGVSVPDPPTMSPAMEQQQQKAELLLLRATVAPPLGVGQGKVEEKKG